MLECMTFNNQWSLMNIVLISTMSMDCIDEFLLLEQLIMMMY